MYIVCAQAHREKDLCIAEPQNEMDSICEQIPSVHACNQMGEQKISSYHFSCAMIALTWTQTQAQSNRLNQLHFGEEKSERASGKDKNKKETHTLTLQQECRFCHGFSWRRLFIKFKIEYKWCLCWNWKTPRNDESISHRECVISSLAIIKMTRQKR